MLGYFYAGDWLPWSSCLWKPPGAQTHTFFICDLKYQESSLVILNINEEVKETSATEFNQNQNQMQFQSATNVTKGHHLLMLILMMLNQLWIVESQWDPSAPSDGSCVPQILNNQWFQTQCGTGTSGTQLMCPNGKWVKSISVKTHLENGSPLCPSAIRLTCDDGTAAGEFDTGYSDTPWTLVTSSGPFPYVYATIGGRSNFFLQFSPYQSFGDGFWGAPWHFRDNGTGCPLVGAFVTGYGIVWDCLSDIRFVFRCPVCQPGSQLNAQRTACQPCAAGTSSGFASVVSCTSCAAGTYQPQTGKSSCLNCPLGQFQDVMGQVACRTCPTGQFQDLTGQPKCLQCPVGQFQNLTGQVACKPCPTGKTSTEGASSCTMDLCAAGRFWDGSACAPCPLGTFKTTEGNTACAPCPLNADCPSGSTSYQCRAGFFLDGNGQCAPCAAGSFKSKNGNESCTICPSGFYQPLTGQTACLPCPAGQSSTAGASACITCAAGQFWDGSTCALCPVGTFKTVAGNSGCVTCPANSHCPSGSTSYQCRAGFFLDGNGQCAPCAAGSFKSGNGNQSCTMCATNFYQPLTGQTACSPCPAGQSSTAGATACTVTCAAGQFWDGSACTPCSPGTFKTIAGNFLCATCPANSNCPSGSTSYQCRAGFFLDGSGQCVPCAAGSFKSSDGNQTCQNCVANFYQPLTGQTACVPCPSGQSSTVGATSCSVTCTAGQFWDGSTCALCPAGTFKTVAVNSGCVTCPANSNCPSGSTSYQCGAGFFLDDSGQCVPCAAGSSKASDGNQTCAQCGPFLYQPSTGQTACLACPSGQSFITGATTCSTTCMAGQFWDGLNCITCPKGSYKTSAGNFACFKCPLNSICTDAVNWQCDVGFELLTGATECSACPKNYFKPAIGNQSCIECPIGATCDSKSIVKCPDGTEVKDDSCVALSQNLGSTVSNIMLIFGSIGGAVILILIALFWIQARRSKNRLKNVVEKGGASGLINETVTTGNSSCRSSVFDLDKIRDGLYSTTGATDTSTVISATSVLAVPQFIAVELNVDYQLLDQIASGSGGSIHRAMALSDEMKSRCPPNCRIVAKKMQCKFLFSVLQPECLKFLVPMKDEQMKLYAFLQEVTIMHRFSKYSYFCPILGFDEVHRTIILKYYPLGSLKNAIQHVKRIPWSKRILVGFACDIAHGIQILHEREVSHSDLKPDNVLIELDPRSNQYSAVLTDFGLGRILSHDLAVKDLRVVLIKGATIQYASPEIIRRHRKIMPKQSNLSESEMAKAGDVYGLACILYDLTNRCPVWSQGSVIPNPWGTAQCIQSRSFSNLLFTETSSTTNYANEQMRTNMSEESDYSQALTFTTQKPTLFPLFGGASSEPLPKSSRSDLIYNRFKQRDITIHDSVIIKSNPTGYSTNTSFDQSTVSGPPVPNPLRQPSANNLRQNGASTESLSNSTDQLNRPVKSNAVRVISQERLNSSPLPSPRTKRQPN